MMLWPRPVIVVVALNEASYACCAAAARYGSEMWRQRLRQFMERMSGRLTPPEVTPVDRIQLMLLPIADLFMILMYSRPPGGSLRTARVTLMTIWLAGAVAVLVGVPAAVLLVHGVAGLQPLPIAIGLVGMAVGLGAGILAVFGVRQRILIAARQETT